MRASSRVALAMLLALAVPSWSQEEPAAPCAPPVPLNLSGNLLSPAQEAGLGQVFHDQYQLDVRLIDDPTLLAYLTAIGRRLQAHLPGDTGEVRFALTDAPGLTGVSVPGRIYISRKLVALARSEDEIAGVMAHELGHLAARHAALGLSRSIRKYLKVTQVDPTESASDLYSRLLDAIARARVDGASNESGEGEDVQQAADRLAVDAMVRSGYQAQGFADFFDRIAETRGKTGNFLSDLVGATSADSKRLRAILRTMSAIPASCVDRFSPDPAAFDAWKAAVIAYTPAAHEKVPGLVWKKDLPEPLLPGVEALAFSPDGRLVLAQDDTGITVLTTSPFRTLFRAAIQEPASMRFAPDSRTFSVLTNTLRVEIWDVESARQISAQEIYRLQPCVQRVLSSDGRFFACHDTEDRLQILEVGTGAILLNRKPFVFAGPSGDSLLGRLLRPATLAFSPDNRYFLGGSDRGDPVLFDLGTRQSVDVPKALKPVVARGFAFVGPQRLATISWQEKGKSLDVVSFPEGKPLSRAPVEAIGELAAAASGDVVMMRPAGLYPVAAFDLATGTSDSRQRGAGLRRVQRSHGERDRRRRPRPSPFQARREERARRHRDPASHIPRARDGVLDHTRPQAPRPLRSDPRISLGSGRGKASRSYAGLRGRASRGGRALDVGGVPSLPDGSCGHREGRSHYREDCGCPRGRSPGAANPARHDRSRFSPRPSRRLASPAPAASSRATSRAESASGRAPSTRPRRSSWLAPGTRPSP
jgi:hypothetical protein